jgi:tetratricopeptide (TPR) repeat protein
MIAGSHYGDDDLLELLASGEDLGANEHLASCDECRARLDSFGMVAGALHDRSVWDERPLSEEPVPSTIATLRAFADQMASEDATASAALTLLLESPRESWTIETLPRTAGMVRKLIEASEQSIDTMPTDSVTLASLAASLATSLDPSVYASDTLSRLRGSSERQHAYALFYTGNFTAAQEALRASESHLSDCLVEEYELARLGIVRALVDRGLEKYDTAIRAARESGETFAVFEDATRSNSARLAEVHLLFSAGQFDVAYQTLIHLKDRVERTYDPAAYARVLANLGHCCWGLRRSAEALFYHEAAAKLFEELGSRSDAIREECSVARVLAYEGRFDDALRRFLNAHDEARQLGMMASAIQASLEAAEILVTRGDFSKVDQICQTAMRALEDAKLAYTGPALMALSLMQEAAEQRRATSTLVRHVRDYLQRVPHQPTLLFAFPPQ